MTRLLFPIGMFPVIMVVVGAGVLRSVVAAAAARARPSAGAGGGARRVRMPRPRRRLRAAGSALAAAPATCSCRSLLPLRAHLYGGNVLWHEQGMRFSWRVMAREKNGSVTFVVRDPRDRPRSGTWRPRST